jgi:hypothetical protein
MEVVFQLLLVVFVFHLSFVLISNHQNTVSKHNVKSL